MATQASKKQRQGQPVHLTPRFQINTYPLYIPRPSSSSLTKRVTLDPLHNGNNIKECGSPWICPNPVNQKQRWIFFILAVRFALEIQNSSQVASNTWKGKEVDEYRRLTFYALESKWGSVCPQTTMIKVGNKGPWAIFIFLFKIWRDAGLEWMKNLKRIKTKVAHV